MINFLIVMQDLKLQIKVGTSKNRYNRVSEGSLSALVTTKFSSPNYLWMDNHPPRDISRSQSVQDLSDKVRLS